MPTEMLVDREFLTDSGAYPDTIVVTDGAGETRRYQLVAEEGDQ